MGYFKSIMMEESPFIVSVKPELSGSEYLSGNGNHDLAGTLEVADGLDLSASEAAEADLAF